MYTVVNSRVYSEGARQGLPGWQIIAIVVDIIALLALAGVEFLLIRGYRRREAGIRRV
jgi:hypothetical protein